MILGLCCAHPDFNSRPSMKQVSMLNFDVAPPHIPLEMPIPDHFSASYKSLTLSFMSSYASGTLSRIWTKKTDIQQCQLVPKNKVLSPRHAILTHKSFAVINWKTSTSSTTLIDFLEMRKTNKIFPSNSSIYSLKCFGKIEGTAIFELEAVILG
ncbi:hypothetical protein CRYUN_Cryun18bG0085500 [Craigia yunnanensis]